MSSPSLTRSASSSQPFPPPSSRANAPSVCARVLSRPVRGVMSARKSSNDSDVSGVDDSAAAISAGPPTPGPIDRNADSSEDVGTRPVPSRSNVRKAARNSSSSSGESTG